MIIEKERKESSLIFFLLSQVFLVPDEDVFRDTAGLLPVPGVSLHTYTHLHTLADTHTYKHTYRQAHTQTLTDRQTHLHTYTQTHTLTCTTTHNSHTHMLIDIPCVLCRSAVGVTTFNSGAGTVYRLNVTKDLVLEYSGTNYNYLPHLVVGKLPGYLNKRSLLQFQNLPAACR